ncbi:MAG: rRNA maturation RNase YbeY [Planctomycetia bacterium]|nr:rRNA maturation RNase YbeY [Planctomycetia bacterium]
MRPHARGAGSDRAEPGEEPHGRLPRTREIPGPEDGVVAPARGGSRPNRTSRRPRARATITVDVSDRQRSLRVGRRWIERLVRRTLACEGIEAAEIGVTLVDDRRIAGIHDRWLGDPTPTDVITFDLSAGVPNEPLRGDVVASAETARRRGREFGWSPRLELAYYLVHGLLHLAGYDDRAADGRRIMRLRERSVMKAVGLPPPPRRRAHP